MISGLISRFSSSTTSAPTDPYAATTHKLRTMIGTCPVCSTDCGSHAGAILAEAGTLCDITKILAAVSNSDWNSLTRLHSFEGQKNAIIAHAVRYPVSAGFLFTILDRFDLYVANEPMQPKTVAPDEWNSMERAFPTLEMAFLLA